MKYSKQFTNYCLILKKEKNQREKEAKGERLDYQLHNFVSKLNKISEPPRLGTSVSRRTKLL